MSQVLTDLAGL